MGQINESPGDDRRNGMASYENEEDLFESGSAPVPSILSGTAAHHIGDLFTGELDRTEEDHETSEDAQTRDRVEAGGDQRIHVLGSVLIEPHPDDDRPAEVMPATGRNNDQEGKEAQHPEGRELHGAVQEVQGVEPRSGGPCRSALDPLSELRLTFEQRLRPPPRGDHPAGPSLSSGTKVHVAARRLTRRSPILPHRRSPLLQS